MTQPDPVVEALEAWDAAEPGTSAKSRAADNLILAFDPKAIPIRCWFPDYRERALRRALTLSRSRIQSLEADNERLRGEWSFRAHLQHQREWSEATFGPGPRAKGVIDHIRKELCEIEADPGDLAEWIDVATLALDGAWRSGHSPDQTIAQIIAKQAKNERREWPDWRTADPDAAIEHVRQALTKETDNAER